MFLGLCSKYQEPSKLSRFFFLFVFSFLNFMEEINALFEGIVLKF